MLNKGNADMTFGEHFDVMRKMLARIVLAIALIGIFIFCFKDLTFKILLAPRDSSFITFRWIEDILKWVGINFRFEKYNVALISTELSAQFMSHVTVSCTLAALLASPYILFELFRFISPALYENEKRSSFYVAGVIYALFIVGLLMSYFVLFPISFRFLATYQVNEEISNTITLASYISTFTTLTFLLGIVFQLPVIAFVLGKMGIVNAGMLSKYRAYAFILIMVIAAIITPPDLFTLILVTGPIYGLYEVSILVLKRFGRS